METTMQNIEMQKLKEKLEEKIEQNEQERKIDDVWKETTELKTKFSTIEQSQTRLFQMLEKIMTQLTRIETLLEEAIEVEEESDSDSENDQTVKVEIVTQQQEQQEQNQQNQQNQTQKKSLMRKILLG